MGLRVASSLRTRVLGLVLVCVSVPATLMSGYLLQRNEEILSEKLRENLANQVFRRANQVDDWMGQRLAEVQRWSTSFVVVEAVEAVAREDAAARAAKDLEEYLTSVLAHYEGYQSLLVIDPAGRVLSSTGSSGWNEEDRRLLEGPGGLGRIGHLRSSPALGRPTLSVLHAIQDRGDRTIGYLVERPDLGALSALLSAGPSSDDAPGFWLLDAEGRVLVRRGRIVDSPGAETFPGRLPEAEEEGGAVGRADLGGTETLYEVRRLRGPFEGFLAATLPVSIAFQPLREARNRLVLILLPALAIVTLVGFAAARRLLHPIQLLSEGARRLSDGDLDVSLPVRGRDEISELTRAFNEMAGRLRDGRRSLEEARDELARMNESLRTANESLETLAITDALTGLFNRRHFQEILDREIRRSGRERLPLTLVMIDLDHFKSFNDRYGHPAGDAELRRVSQRVLKAIRTTDSVFRYGGEELAVLLPGCPLDQAAEVAEKIRASINSEGDPDDGSTTISAGVACFPDDAQDGDSLLSAADAALYSAKAAGRDRVVLASPPADGSPPPAR
jgi:diguanylate cyclase (GGDEF)-like protein